MNGWFGQHHIRIMDLPQHLVLSLYNAPAHHPTLISPMHLLSPTRLNSFSPNLREVGLYLSRVLLFNYCDVNVLLCRLLGTGVSLCNCSVSWTIVTWTEYLLNKSLQSKSQLNRFEIHTSNISTNEICKIETYSQLNNICKAKAWLSPTGAIFLNQWPRVIYFQLARDRGPIWWLMTILFD